MPKPAKTITRWERVRPSLWLCYCQAAGCPWRAWASSTDVAAGLANEHELAVHPGTVSSKKAIQRAKRARQYRKGNG